MRVTLTVWRQAGANAPGAFETYDVPGVSPDMSFLELLDELNERLQLDGKEPVAFDDGSHLTIEPWRAAAFPLVRDLIVDRSAFDRIIEAGGYVGVGTGGSPD